MSFLKKLFKKQTHEIDYNALPAHIAIIMDGNGRWAKRRGMPRTIGHREGAGTLKKLVTFCGDIGIKYLTVYAFSTENWKRPKAVVDALMSLLLDYLRNAEREIGGKDVRIRVIGDVATMPEEIKREIERVTQSTANNKGLCLNIALNYGSRDEIIFAVKEIIKDVKQGKLQPEDIDEQVISARLYTLGIPDPDLLIRTSGEKRVSNFLLWQAAYTEFWYTDILWPDFDHNSLLEAIKEYQNRNRRFGGV